MRKSVCKLLMCFVCLLVLSGCRSSRSLGERAIVKMLYLDETDGQVQAALVVFTCAPSSDVASVEGQAKIYMAAGDGIEDALYRAEQQQNKKPFYAQNELLLLGPGAARNAAPYLSHFGGENAARPNLAVFITPLTIQELAECEEVISDVVREGERLIEAEAGEADCTQNVYELDLSSPGGVSGYLPVFTFSKDEKEFCGVRQLMLFHKGRPIGLLSDTEMQMALLLAGKAHRLAVSTKLNGDSVSFRTQGVQLGREAGTRDGAPHLVLRLSGKLEEVAVNGVPVRDEAAAGIAEEVNRYLEGRARLLNKLTFESGNDIFHYGWWLKLHDAALCERLLDSGAFYHTAQVEFRAELKPA